MFSKQAKFSKQPSSPSPGTFLTLVPAPQALSRAAPAFPSHRQDSGGPLVIRPERGNQSPDWGVLGGEHRTVSEGTCRRIQKLL